MCVYVCQCNQVNSLLSESRCAQLVLTLSDWNRWKPQQSKFCYVNNRLVSVWNESVRVTSSPVCIHQAHWPQEYGIAVFNKRWFVWLTNKIMAHNKDMYATKQNHQSLAQHWKNSWYIVNTSYWIIKNIPIGRSSISIREYNWVTAGQPVGTAETTAWRIHAEHLIIKHSLEVSSNKDLKIVDSFLACLKRLHCTVAFRIWEIT